MYSSSEEEEYDCPLCMEELDIADRNFRPCPCGYKICRFCWHHIRENLNGRCPACRREYSDQIAEFEPVSADEISRIKKEKKEKERQQRDMELANRRHLANMRVVQKNLVYIIGLHPKLATEEIIRSPEYFGHFGKIAKVVINKRQIAPTSHANGATSMQPSAAVYVTYARKEDAAKAIHAVDGSVMAGRILRASYGTTKYCTYYLRNMACPNPNCLYLHEPGEDADTISKEELATGKHRMRDQMSHADSEEEHHHQHHEEHHVKSVLSSADFPPVSLSSPTKEERSALPATASWGKTSTPGTPTIKNTSLPERALTPDTFGPPLSVAVAQQLQQQQQQKNQQLSPTVLKRKLEKKKRKELLRQKKEEELQQQQQQQQEEEEQKPNKKFQFDSLVHFVLGDAFEQVCTPTTEDECFFKPVGVTGLYENYNSSSDEDNNLSTPPVLEMEKLNLNNNQQEDSISPLEYLTRAVPNTTYTGTFNPFAHHLFPAIIDSTLIGNNTNINTTTNALLFDPSARKTSRFGFAQF
ncbi:uncharacterized protein BX663DRAFT_491569 [Cokeromyces recurvatus]|uniref:uncharacterized protein n=1 Tax=Cokeromyces recurvatus TaxID=90255 RepID=UPI0022210D52|nr:uncharacterized protein BX663DRAFT_491569 [Cokeromyces recurvatus]KAI7907650.1 hypothetical protein BX663DRAFT_491569 [Cokeromyces recurvatus]